MSRKIFIGIKILFPLIINMIFYLIISQVLNNTEFVLADTLFYLGIINILIGLITLVVKRRFVGSYINSKYGDDNIVIIKQKIKDYHAGKWGNDSAKSLINIYLKLIYIFLGGLLIIFAIVA